ncbi:hypothetical protein NIES4071_88090 [Calothrix sp. NIES-4071]|nr:hypothetical protein NIES4071_88090 [Calothrix sp. NIES-4071]BAZ63076.1 hypothetical protein NIES4105_88020 [Calothrix sp. NIES-4105]
MSNHTKCLEPETTGKHNTLKLNKQAGVKNNLHFFSFLHQILQNIISFISINPDEVQVHQRTDRYGNQYWHAYHPRSRQSFFSGSEDDVRIWIEQLYQNKL